MLPLLPLRRFLRRLRRRVSAFTWFAIGALLLAVLAFATQKSPRGWRPPSPRPSYPTSLPAEVTTALGRMSFEGEYLPGVVDCEISYYTQDPDALKAQAIAARTYVARFLAMRGDDATIPIGPHFQCWRPVVYERSREAVDGTRGLVIRHDGTLITGNYAAGARARNAKCEPLSPKVHGLSHATWGGVKRAYEKGTRFSGAYWTEIFVTANAGRRGRDVTATTLGSRVPENRGGLGQHAAICLAERWGATAEKILRHFYGEDIVVSL